VLGTFSRRTYRHAGDVSRTIEVGRIAGQPAEGKWTFATVGLADVDWNEPERARVELVLASSLDEEVCAHVLANLAFHLTANRFYPAPGKVVRDVVGALGAGSLSQRLPHVYVQVPAGWSFALPLDARPPALTLAQVCPISEAEYKMWRQLGADRFERTLAARDIDLANLGRKA
jgi:hypothetical protein